MVGACICVVVFLHVAFVGLADAGPGGDGRRSCFCFCGAPSHDPGSFPERFVCVHSGDREEARERGKEA